MPSYSLLSNQPSKAINFADHMRIVSETGFGQSHTISPLNEYGLEKMEGEIEESEFDEAAVPAYQLI